MLPTETVYQGRILRQIKRQGMAALYEVRNKGNTLYGYEVIIITIEPAKELFGRALPERESYPKAEDWGDLAWSFPRIAKKQAFACFNGLLKRYGTTPPAANLANLEGSEGRDRGL
ncbi:MAG: hypothetical protein JO170_07270 [Verrucomicrobia bacterium]|nr:hypothetical protein [Verrucomicrobiota bacterium]